MKLTVDKKEVGKRITKYREERHLSKKKLAEMIAVNSSSITRFEKGVRPVSDEILDAMAEVFGIDPFLLKYGVVIRSNISNETIDSLIVKRLEEMCINMPNVGGTFRLVHVDE